MRPSLKRRAEKQRPVGCYLRNQLRVPYAVPQELPVNSLNAPLKSLNLSQAAMFEGRIAGDSVRSWKPPTVPTRENHWGIVCFMVLLTRASSCQSWAYGGQDWQEKHRDRNSLDFICNFWGSIRGTSHLQHALSSVATTCCQWLSDFSIALETCWSCWARFRLSQLWKTWCLWHFDHPEASQTSLQGS